MIRHENKIFIHCKVSEISCTADSGMGVSFSETAQFTVLLTVLAIELN